MKAVEIMYYEPCITDPYWQVVFLVYNDESKQTWKNYSLVATTINETIGKLITLMFTEHNKNKLFTVELSREIWTQLTENGFIYDTIN